MSEKQISLRIDEKICIASTGQFIIEAAQQNGIYIPTLCNYDGMYPVGGCRVCTVLVNGRPMPACTTKVENDMEVCSTCDELDDTRKSIIEMLLASGNHFCPTCEKSGNCELQALAYRFRILVPRYTYLNPVRELDASSPRFILERNRCILCKRCVRGITTDEGKHVFSPVNRGNKIQISIDPECAATLSEETAERAMKNCPVGCIIKKGNGFRVPIGRRKYDKNVIGSDHEANVDMVNT